MTGAAWCPLPMAAYGGHYQRGHDAAGLAVQAPMGTKSYLWRLTLLTEAWWFASRHGLGDCPGPAPHLLLMLRSCRHLPRTLLTLHGLGTAPHRAAPA